MSLLLHFFWFSILVVPIDGLNELINLSGKWKFFSSNQSVTGTGTVPGDIYSDLYASGIIDDPLYGENHLNLKWISEDDWTYSKTITLEKEKGTAGIFLELASVDTISTVYVNGHKVLHTRNQFLPYHVNITDLIHRGDNQIAIKFKSPVKYSRKRAKEYVNVFGHKLPPDCNPDVYHGECHQNFIRKAQYSYAWDWGPSFPSVGISGPITINIYRGQLFHDFSCKTKFVGGKWHLDFEFDTFHYGARTIEYIVEIPELGIRESDYYRLSATKSLQTRSKNVLSLTIPVEKEPERWWPNGMGKQKMYDVVVSMGDQVKTKKFGFKTIELVQDLIDANKPAQGRHFYFKINGEPVFLKGTNWIPVSMFRNETENVKRMKFLLDSAVEVGMNVMRVWGGGFYESKEFYQYASEKGILIWQDLMFACALYPTTEEFVKNVEEEVKYQVNAISQHPAILVFSGNNENEAAIRGHWWKTFNYTENQQIKDYVLLNSRLAKITRKIAPTIPFIMSSPSNGVETEEEGGVAKNPYDERYGDIHYYNEFVNLWRDETFLTPRCASEYGIQSYPLKETMLNWIKESDWEYTSKTMFHRQHHPGGIATNLLMIFQHLPIPSDCNSKNVSEIRNCKYISSSSYMSRLAYFSQIHQAIALKTQTYHYRRFRNVTTEDGLGNTMCAMYWQLNDVWAAPTWSTIDFDQNWKMAHYEAKRFFSSVAVYSFADEADFNLKVYLLNDKSYNIKNLTVSIQQLSWANGLDPILTNKFHIDTVPAATSQTLNTGITFPKLSDLSEYVFVSTLYNSTGEKIHEDVLLPDFLFEIDFKAFGDVHIGDVQRIDKLTYEITITTDKISPFTWISTKKPFVGWFSNNGFHMIEQLQKIRLFTKIEVDLQKTDFTVCNLKNCYV
uniref:beta-mannosidase n=1 Tax=Caenorhabditis tropicalis TaxID=1561998 RepID=A0A1I7V3Q8_9PELO